MRALLAEDNDNDAELVELALAEAGIPVELTRVENGDECLRFLRRQAPYESAQPQDLVFLDINMPIKDGYQVMDELLADDSLKHQPVVILTTSDREEDVVAMYRKRCNSYAVKPSTFSEFAELMKKTLVHWAVMARPLPRP